MRIFLEHMRNGSRKIHTTKARAGEKCHGARRDGADRRDCGECKRRRCSHCCCRPYRRWRTRTTKTRQAAIFLTDTEQEMVERVSKAFARTIVVLNVGNIIDMKWVKECNPAAVLYVWQGGQEGGNGVADVLTGKSQSVR